nr:hypothetical protein [Methylobacterium sp. 10]
MPTHMLQAGLAAGRLIELHLPKAKHRRLSFAAQSSGPPGPASRWLIQRFDDQGADEPCRPTHTHRPRRSRSRRADPFSRKK